MKKMRWIVLALILGGPVLADLPPELINYQGVLRDAADAPLDGSFDMRFRLYDSDGGGCPAAGGTLLLTDEHLAAGTGAVAVTAGLFDLQIGSGTLVPGSRSSLGDVLTENPVWAEVEVNGEILCPRTRLVAAPYALSTRSVAGESGGDLSWNSTFSRFEIDGAGVGMNGPLHVGSLFSAPTIISYNRMGFVGVPCNSGFMGSRGDLCLDEDLEVVGVANFNGDVRMDDDGPDGNQSLYFYNFGSPVGEALTWDDASDRFGFSDSVALTEPGAQLLADDGSGAAPGLAFASAPDMGLARIGSFLGLTVGGSEKVLVNASGDLVAASRLFVGCGSSPGSCPGIQAISYDTLNTRFVMQDDLIVFASLNVVGSPAQIYLGGQLNFEIEPLFGDFQIHKDMDNESPASWFRVWEDADQFEQMRILSGDEADALFDGTVTSNGLDYAEAFEVVEGSTIEAGDVVSLDPQRAGHILRTTAAYDPTAIGVVSARPGYLTGLSFDAEDEADPELRELRDAARERGDDAEARRMTVELAARAKATHRAVALVGRVPVKVVAHNGAIRAGDRLTGSDVPGHAMRMTGSGHSIGIALEDWDGTGPGQVLTFIQPGWFGEPTSTVPVATADGSRPEAATAPTMADAAAPTPNHEVVLDRDRPRFSVVGGNDVAKADPDLFRVNERGDVFARGAFRPAAMDVAEFFPLSEAAEPGSVLALDPERPGQLRLAREAADGRVVGVVSTEPGMLLGSGIQRMIGASPELAAQLGEARQIGDGEAEARVLQELESRFLLTHAPVALTGTVNVKVDAGYGAVYPGDLLTSSPTPGHAMAAQDPKAGTVLGKALEGLEVGTGVVRMLVMSR